ncbi:DNA replication and repair protein RecN [Cnuella takakiae]|uniref:DNA repair protein RecN n=1 Tax=Cnuella takakiae TaxID=1302690 RepID=A0A1M5FNB8_9BACT|nr:DNA repair protein RecN [Cnuella takakiae]SHF92672.1 DNA replication and repair protein RecN [Cnuella takakiae]
MLKKLLINNYAIIDELEIDFSGNLNILTGETGAGKSIIMGALGLILGQRAETGSLRNRERKCVVEGVFSNDNDGVAELLREADLDPEEAEVVVRREIQPSGKSRAFVNDTPVNLSQLQQVTNMLVDLHQQFDTLELGESDFQREVLDALGGNAAAIKAYQRLYTDAQAARRRFEALREQKTQFDKEFDYHQFQFSELDEAGFRPDELEESETELKLLNNAEGIKTALAKGYYELAESEEPVTRQLKALYASLQQYAELHPLLPELVKRIESAYIELQDIADEVDRVHGDINFDPATIEQLNDRLSLGYKLLKKHGVKTTNELLAIRDALNEKLQAVLNIDEAIQKAEAEYKHLLSEAEAAAEKISAARKKVVAPLQEKVDAMLRQVGMPNARIRVDIKKVGLNATGFDEVEFLFDANRSNNFNPLRKVASGGELSRLMLCIKSLVAQSIDLPTLIFDEIDTGISGEAAKQVGIIMKDLAGTRQVICITHQPQIAGRADAHFFVYKNTKADTVTTGVRMLSTDERIVAIAQMMSGEKPSAAALENAREMVTAD